MEKHKNKIEKKKIKNPFLDQIVMPNSKLRRSKETYIISNNYCWFGFFCTLVDTLFAFDGKLPHAFVFPCIFIGRITRLDNVNDETPCYTLSQQ